MPELGVSNAQLILAAKQTAYMVFVSLAAGTVLAMIMAFALVLTRSDSILPNRFIYGILNTIINTVRSVPFIILMVFIMPLTKMVVGTRIGTTAALVPLVIFIAPYLTRLFENSLLDVDRGIIEAAQAMGASYFEIIWYFPAGSKRIPHPFHYDRDNRPFRGHGHGRCNWSRRRRGSGLDVWL